MLLVFRGEDAIRKIQNAVGHIVHERTSGETIRDTYGDYIADEFGEGDLFRARRAGGIRRRLRSSAT